MSKGFLVLAQNNSNSDYVKQAYALALSIKLTQKNVTSISLVTNDTVADQYTEVFDNIIPIPWDDDAKDKEWKVENRWKLFHVTPYDETIVLDTDMLFLEDVSLWWRYCENYDLQFCNKVKNYKNEIILEDTHHRKAFISNNLGNPYFALHYFKKCDLAYEFYKVLEFVSNNWEWFYTEFAPENYQNWLSMDLASAIAIEVMGIHEQVLDKCSPLEFVHMKPALQNWNPVPLTWQDTVPCVHTVNGEIIIGSIRQSKLFHYVEKNFLTSNIIKRLEGLVYGTE